MKKEDIYGAASAKLFTAEQLATIDKRFALPGGTCRRGQAYCGHGLGWPPGGAGALPDIKSSYVGASTERHRLIPGLLTKERSRGSRHMGVKPVVASPRWRAGYIVLT